MKFVVIANVYLCGKLLSSPVLYANNKYVSYIWTVICLFILTSSNISEIYMTAYFEYFYDILDVVHNHSSSAPYHLTGWRKQICWFVSEIWAEHSKVLCDWGCESCAWIVWQYLIGFLLLFPSFELHFIWLNHLSTCILFYWTVPATVHWLNCFSCCIVFDWTIYLAISCFLNCLPAYILFAEPFT